MIEKRRSFGFLLVALAFLPVSPIFGATITVTNTNDSGPGSLRAAIAATAPGDTINFSLASPATITVHSFLTIGTNLNIKGPGASNLAIESDEVGVFEITAGTVTLSDLSIGNSQAPLNGSYSYGLGIYSPNNATATIINSTISGNKGTTFGAAINNSGTMTIVNSTVSGNVAWMSYGAGIFNNGTMTVTDSIISNNEANFAGGGIYNNGILTITNSSISGNSTNGYGGGIYNNYLFNGKMTITNSTISGNRGGGILSTATLTITNSTISGNTALYAGTASGIQAAGGTVKNSIVAGNGPPGGNCSFTGTVTSAGHNLSDDSSCADYFTGPGDLNNTSSGLDPAGLKNNGGPTPTIALLSGVAVYSIPLGPVNYCTLPDGKTPVATDQRGVTRPQSPWGCSVGAYEPAAASAYAQLKALYIALESQINNLPATDKVGKDRDRDGDKDHRRRLRDAVDELSEMLNAKNWIGTDGNHIDRDRSFRFFVDDQVVAEDLTRILHDNDERRQDEGAIPPQEIRTDLSNLANANRTLATTAIADAAGKNAELLARANAKLGDGDEAAAESHYERAVADYTKAWSLAENAR